MTEKMTTPSSHIAEYRQYVESLPTGEFSYSISTATYYQRVYEQSIYCGAGYRSKRMDKQQSIDVLPFPEGYIRPYFIDTADSLLRHVSNRTDYTPARAPEEDERARQTDYRYADRRRESEPWEKVYMQHIKQRHAFHAAFLESAAGINTLSPREVFDNARAALKVRTPYATAQTEQQQRALDKLFNYPEWMGYSLANVLFATPDTLSAEFQQKALRLFAEQVTDAEMTQFASGKVLYIGTDDKAATTGKRLPPSFLRTHEELAATSHPKWRSNKVISELFGDMTGKRFRPFSAGCNQLLVEHPDDLMQVLLLNLADGYNADALPTLHALGKLPQALLDTVVHEQASYRTVHIEPTNSYEMMRKALGVFPNTLPQSDDPETLRAMLGALSSSVVYLRADVRERDATISNLSNSVTMHENRIQVQPLFARHGINIDGNLTVTGILVNHLRQVYARLYHPNGGSQPNAEALKTCNAELDEILRLKGIRSHNTYKGSDTVESDAFVQATRSLISEFPHAGEKPVPWSARSQALVVDAVYQKLANLPVDNLQPYVDLLLQSLNPPEMQAGQEAAPDNRTATEKVVHQFLRSLTIEPKQTNLAETELHNRYQVSKERNTTQPNS